jgi:hypothetical protein
VVYGIGLIFIPTTMLSWFDLTLTQELTLLAQIFGGALIGYAVIFWMTQGDAPSKTRKTIILGEVVHSLIATILWVIAIVGGVGNTLMYLPLFSHVSLVIWFGYLYIKG